MHIILPLYFTNNDYVNKNIDFSIDVAQNKMFFNNNGNYTISTKQQRVFIIHSTRNNYKRHNSCTMSKKHVIKHKV